MRAYSSMRLVAATMLMLAACGGDPFGGLDKETDFGPEVTDGGEQAAALSSVTDAQTMEGMTTDQQVGESSVSFFGNAANAPLQIVNSALVQQRNIELGTDLYQQTVERAALGQVLVPAAGFPECVESSVGSVHFDHCEVLTDTTTTTLNGSVEVVDADRVVADIHVDATIHSDSGQSISTSTNVDADMTVTDTLIEGSVDVGVSASIPGVGAAGQTSVALYNIELDNGCAVGGDLRVGVVQKAVAGGQTQKLRAVGRAVFGPECNQVTVYARAD